MIGVVIVRNSHLDTRTCRRFRYSDPQRQRITACVRNHDRFDFLALEYAANRYLATIGKRIRLPKERLKTIAAIGRLAITLRAKITGLNNPRDQEVFDTFLSIGGTSFRQTLGGLADLCRNQDTLLRRKLRPAVETPKLAFYREALSLLTDADGALKVKQRDGDPYGPTLDYLKAITVR
jgi:hypothetical protein